MSYPYGPQADCCCKLFRDEFDRASINTSSEPRYQESNSGVTAWGFGLSSWSYTTSAWSIVGGVLKCSTGGTWLRHFATSLSTADLPPLAYTQHVSWEFDLTYTGSGAVYLGRYLALNYGTGTISIRDRNLGTTIYTFPWSLVSGTTYRITIRTSAAAAGATQDFELLIDGVPVKKTKIAQQHWGVYGFVGTGTLEIDNVAVDKLYNTPCGSDCPQVLAPCFYPWLPAHPGAIQVDVPGEVVTGCADCTTPIKNVLFQGSWVLDRMTSGFESLSLVGTYLPCSYYQLADTFGCYNKLQLSFGVETVNSGFSITHYERVDFLWLRTGGTHHIGWRLGNTNSTSELIYTGSDIVIGSANLGAGTCRPISMALTPIP